MSAIMDIYQWKELPGGIMAFKCCPGPDLSIALVQMEDKWTIEVHTAFGQLKCSFTADTTCRAQLAAANIVQSIAAKLYRSACGCKIPLEWADNSTAEKPTEPVLTFSIFLGAAFAEWSATKKQWIFLELDGSSSTGESCEDDSIIAWAYVSMPVFPEEK